MKNAREARDKALYVKNNIVATELASAEKAIDDAINNGEMSTSYYSKLSTDTRETLKNLGYTVKDQSSQRDGLVFIISW